MRRLSIAFLAIATLGVACARSTTEATSVAPTAESSPDKFDKYTLGVCETKRVKVRETEPGAGEVTRDDVIAKYSPEPDRVVHGEVTIGNTDYTAPTADSIATSTNGKKLDQIAAWVVVREGLSIPASGAGGDEADVSTIPGADRSFTAFAEVVDAETGVVLHGWSCGTRTKSADGRVVEWRGVDPDLREKKEKQA